MSSLKSNVGMRFTASCEKPEGPYINITLIDCETREMVTERSSIPYVALSYVWGNSITVPLVEDPESREKKLPSQVSRSIEDAIAVTRYLGMRFLWADKYCIDQENKAVMDQQINQMHEVYRHADLTIVAAVGDDAEAGLAPTCAPSEVTTAWFSGFTDDAWNPFVFDTEAQQQVVPALAAIGSAVWNTRGWTYRRRTFRAASSSSTPVGSTTSVAPRP